MKTLEYKIEIDAPRNKVWDTMLSADSYPIWTNVAWPGSFYEGKWKRGENVRFISKDGSGTLATLEEVDVHESILARHVAILLPGGVEDRTSDMAKGWVGTTEEYTFSGKNGSTQLVVKLKINPDWEKMFNDGWPKALTKLKEISEQ